MVGHDAVTGRLEVVLLLETDDVVEGHRRRSWQLVEGHQQRVLLLEQIDAGDRPREPGAERAGVVTADPAIGLPGVVRQPCA